MLCYVLCPLWPLGFVVTFLDALLHASFLLRFLLPASCLLLVCLWFRRVFVASRRNYVILPHFVERTFLVDLTT